MGTLMRSLLLLTNNRVLPGALQCCRCCCNMLEDCKGRAAGKERSNKVKSSPDRADGTFYSRSGRSDRNPRMVRGSGSTRTSGRGEDGGDDDDDEDGAGFSIGGGNRKYEPFNGWNSKNDAWMRNRKQLCIAAFPGASVN
eukprot:6217182-Amphidinium_carterae.1